MQRPVSPWLKVFVAFHVVAITVAALPRPTADVVSGKAKPFGSDYLLKFNEETLRPLAPFQAYYYVTGTWQYWDMFAPDPADTDIWVDAEATFEDGSSAIIAYPRMYELSLGEKYLEERFRKFYERVNQENYAYLWPVFCRVMARSALQQTGKAPRIIALRRHFLKIAPPNEKQAEKYTDYEYFRYVVQPEDLR